MWREETGWGLTSWGPRGGREESMVVLCEEGLLSKGWTVGLI